MKRIIAMLLSLILAASLLTACSSSNTGTDKGGAEATTEEADDYLDDMPEEPKVDHPEDYVKLGKYQGITIKKDSVKVTDKEVDEAIRSYLEPEIVDVDDRDTVKKGDILDIDYEISVDGEPVEDYIEEGRTYYLGENELAFLKKDIDKDLIGKKIGDQFDIKNTFVDDLADQEIDYSDYDDEYDDYDDALSADDLGDDEESDALDDDGEIPFEEDVPDDEDEDAALAGKDCVVTVTINAIQKEEMPELNDEYVQDYTNGEYKTVEEYRKATKEEMESYAQESADEEAMTDLMNEITKNAEQLKDFPEDLIKEEADYLTEEMAAEMYEDMEEDEEQAFEEYFKANYPDYKDINEYAVHSLKYSCVHDLLVEVYKIEPTDDDIKEAAEYYLSWGFESVEDVMKDIPKEDLEDMAVDIQLEKKLKEDNTIVEAEEK